ncbi:MAG: bifunctional (p)ppGpp synthetase/guanosine-3',5'-bis(diphosphate) 3'-pyrophosphohydrolase [Alphaproteobacteria bacterium]|nr:MAG: bifunctional (p)ppGpp synthetase/guanosine-3',5'-bis(diphosphate) 3'-pyrophosphohydrolase [Alphaproteobacteria bacterium]TAF41917.1 MAG: bifunctional (p)ppGpp synthetase/guanosine-3',5'-bis(diphosphate) 3'-pyrophosphohydrolase [Alphaproteobacteria bacterium]TAF76780.1 MAG: bifunctional (p)ppGpp synthetase/guanosine-3',5'-bis(diphosphate) 3'-pyrophosphohydrolase [Alphaproteobacteria bacterium]
MKTAIDLIQAMCVYEPKTDYELIRRAYDFGLHAHSGQMRASGEPYFSHPVEVAYYLTTMKLDAASIITALLHDTVEDTDATLDDITRLFGAEIANLVDGVTKLNRLEMSTEKSKAPSQAENFRKLVLAMSKDLRVLVVKLADRLHNMQTIHYVRSEEKRQKKARETLDIYTPLAERIGMRNVKEELQDLCFAVLHPDARESIMNRLEFLRETGLPEIERIRESLQHLLCVHSLPTAIVSGRQKRPYSIWRKMEMKNISFEQLGDVMGFRILTNTVGDCYQALGIIHNEFHTIPGRFKDYISTPKVNGYQSIHTEVIGPNKQRVEIQIRTQEMQDVAENGVAAHWSYKQGKNASHEGKQFQWMRQLLDILEKTDDADEFLEHTKLEMYHDQVFCFTPKGDIMALPRGATPVDFAFQVHSGVGCRCVGAKVNGRIVPLKTHLHNGDQVEIITSKTQTPSPAWERFVVTGKARSEIRKFIRTAQREEYLTLGNGILQKTFKKEQVEFKEKDLEKALETLKHKTIDDVFVAIGEGTLSRNRVFEVITGKPVSTVHSGKEKKLVFLPKLRREKERAKHSLPISGLVPGMAIHFAGCCHPIPGDKIVGIVTTGKGVTIHTMDCDTLENYSDAPERWIDVAWDASEEQQSYIGRIKVMVNHEPGAIATLTQVIASEKGNINNFKITNRTTDHFEILIDIEVLGDSHMNAIMKGLKHKNLIQSVERYNG